MTENGNRPSPEALLKEAESELRGKLKIFLGAAPGVGKTYAMLSAAKSRLGEGVDTVIGLVETHQRSETQMLAEGIEVMPKQKLAYRGLSFDEMDLDAILKRKPKLVLVDELAHTNIPGARHPKRYQDVQEILEAGIDVYSTLNVQHIESLNDIVTRITGVKVRETVPDTVVQMANSIELIDLPPDELLQRLKEGKVYIPEQARLAVNRFFTPGNLTALRELALRQAAERVDDQMTSYMRRHAIAGPWPTSSRVMVCIAGDTQAASLVRAARRSAERRQTPWLVLYVETRHHALLPEKARQDIAQAMAMAEGMGAETMTVASEDIAQEIVRVARERNVSTIIVGKPARSLVSRWMRPSVAEAVLSEASGFDVLFVNAISDTSKQASADPETPRWRFGWGGFGKAGFIVGLACLTATVAGTLIAPYVLPFFFIIAVLLVALDTNLVAAFCATLVCALAQIVLMTAPRFSLIPPREEDAISLLGFVATGIAVGVIGDIVRRRVEATRRNAERTQSLYDFTKSIAAAATIDDVAQATVRRVAMTLGARVAVLLPRHERLEVAASVPADLKLDTASDAAMDWAWRHGKPAGFKSNTLPGAAFYGLPLQVGSATLGVLAVQVENGGELTSSQNHFFISLAYQAAAAIERAKLVADVAQARLQTETEKLHASLLSSISRDLREPLDNIIVTAKSLIDGGEAILPERRRVLVAHIGQESDKLDRFVENLLDMTELVTGSAHFNRQPLALRELIGKALARLSLLLEGREVLIDVPDDLPLIEADSDTLRRVFVNVIENACAYSLPDQPITIVVKQDGRDVKIAVTDQGLGIPESERERVFDMFYRIKKGGGVDSVAGVGLGLSICRGFVEAHQGHISAQSGKGGVGTSIVIRLPVTNEPINYKK